MGNLLVTQMFFKKSSIRYLINKDKFIRIFTAIVNIEFQ
jgi:hypothetical protein